MSDSRLTTWGEASCRRVHEAILAVLADPGVELLHEGARDLLREAGARVEGTRVRFDPALVARALESAPRSFVVPSRGGHDDLVIEDGRVYYGTGGDCLYVHDLDSEERRRARLSDVVAFAAVTEQLPDLDYVMSMALPEDVPETGIDVAVVGALLSATRKPLLICATCPPEALAELRDMAGMCGAADSLMVYAMASPPLKMDASAAGRLIACAELGIPLIWSGGPGPGISAPCSRAGIRAAGPGGSHLARPYTRKQHRTLWQPTVVDQWMHDHWVEQGATTLLDRLRARARELRDAPPAFTLSDEVLAKLDDAVQSAGGPALAR